MAGNSLAVSKPRYDFKELHALPATKAGAYKITSSKSFV